jgi:cystathionine beta-lyase/cystathionine gamma-synthase
VSGFSTRAIRAASRTPRLDQDPTAVPIYQSATFSSEDAEALGDVLTDRVHGYAYSRIDNPTVAALAAAVAELEGAEGGFAFATGMGAIHAALIALVSTGERVVASSALYGSTRSLLTGVLTRFGVEVAFVDITDHQAVRRALAVAPTRVLYAETISNPTIVVADHAVLADLAHAAHATYVVDNTFASPYLCRPIEHGADLVVESATKYLGGHSDVLAGVVSGSARLIERVRGVQTDTGATLSPLAAFLVLRGITTLGLRMDRHSGSAAALATWFEGQAAIERVWHPSLASHPQAEAARRMLASGGGMLALQLAGGRIAGEAFIDALTIPQRTASLGSVHTMVVHPPSTTHRQLSEAELEAAGIAPGLLRISVGIEDVEDLREDLARGLEAARSAGEGKADADAQAARSSVLASPVP